jgi:hypothetical protein
MRGPLKIVLLSIAALVLVTGISAGTILLLRTFINPSKKAPIATSIQLKTVDAPDVLVKAYDNASPLGDRSTTYTKRTLTVPTSISKSVNYQNTTEASTSPTNTTILYQKDSSTYQTNIGLMDNTQYLRKDVSIQKNSAAIISATDSFLTSKGLIKAQTNTDVSGITYVTYDSSNVICQTSDFDATTKTAAAYGLACVLKSLVNDRYTLLNSLLALYQNSKQMGTLKSVTTSIDATSGTKHLIIIFVVPKNGASKTVYFASFGEAWSYLGDRGVTNPDDASSFTLSDQLKSAITDPKWGNFLTQYIE